MHRRVWVIAAPAAVLIITFLLFAWMSLGHSDKSQALNTSHPSARPASR